MSIFRIPSIALLTLALANCASTQTRAPTSDLQPRPVKAAPELHVLLWDLNGDGKYTCDEWKQFVGGLFDVADRNRNGFLDRAEFDSIRKSQADFANAEFEYFDDNRDGRLSRGEFIERKSPLIDRLDRNGDCILTRAEIDEPPQQKTTKAADGKNEVK